jgi:DivIVA protein
MGPPCRYCGKRTMSDSSSQRLRLSLLGYRRTQVEVALAELRLTVRHLQEDVTETRERARRLEDELREARIELDSRRARETEITQAFEAAQERVREVEAAAEMTARAILAEAEEKASRTRAEAHLRTESVSGQIDELLRLRDTLVQTMRGVIRDFDYAVERVEKGESVLPAEPTAAALPEPAANGNGNGNGHVNGTANGNGAHPARPRGPEDEQAFEGRVELDAGPFGDFAALSSFERSLSRLAGVEDVYVRRFSGDRALIELTLAHPLPLLAEMRDHMPYGLDVQAIEPGRLAVTVAVAAGTY